MAAERADLEKSSRIPSPVSPDVEKSKPPMGEKRPIPRIQLILLNTSLCIGMFLSLLDTSIVATALFSIGSDFKALESAAWVALSYTLAYLGCAVPFAAVSDVIGRRASYLVAYGTFLGASLACGFAPSLNFLIGFRVMQGIGGAGLYSLTMVIFPEITPPKSRGMIGTLASAVVAIAGISGPFLGGLVTRFVTWRWAFWLNGPIALPGMVIFALTWPQPDQRYGSQVRRKWRELDVVGSFLIIAASVLTVFAFQQAGINPNSWDQAIFILPLLYGFVSWLFLLLWQLCVHMYWQKRVAAVLPWRLITHRVYMGGVLFTMLMGFPYLLIIYTLPLRFQVINAASPLFAGLYLLPMLGASAIGSYIGGKANEKKNRVTIIFATASVFLTLGTLLMVLLDLSSGVQPLTYGAEVLIGLGFGLAISNASLSSSLESSLRDAAVAQGVTAQVRILGGSLGIAASTAILGLTQQSELAGIVKSSQLANLRDAATTLTPPQYQAVRKSFADAFSLDVKIAAIICASTVVAALMTWRRGAAMDIATRRAQQGKAEYERVAAEMKAAAIEKALHRAHS